MDRLINRLIDSLVWFDWLQLIVPQNECVKPQCFILFLVVGDRLVNSTAQVLSSKLPVIPVIVFACNRPTVKRNLDQLLKWVYRRRTTYFRWLLDFLSIFFGHFKNQTVPVRVFYRFNFREINVFKLINQSVNQWVSRCHALPHWVGA